MTQMIKSFSFDWRSLKEAGYEDLKAFPLFYVTKEENGDKAIQFVEKPKKDYYLLKNKYWDQKLRPSAKIDMVQKFSAPSKSLESAIVNSLAKMGDNEVKDWWDNARTSNSYQARKAVLRDLRVFSADGNLADEYIAKFNKQHPRESEFYGITRSFADIEVDGTKVRGFPEPTEAKAPINIITHYSDDKKNVYVLVLEDLESESYIELAKTGFKDVYDALNQRYNVEEKRNITFLPAEVYKAENELAMISRFFDILNEEDRPDYLSGWNFSFDMEYFYNRIINLNGDPNTIMSANGVPIPYASVKVDNRSSDIADKTDIFDIVNYTNIVDEMDIYANFTKPLGKEESYSLDYIGEKITGTKKNEFEGSIRDLHKRDYYSFMLYNIQDVILVADIDENTGHLSQLDTIGGITSTRATHALKKTISIRNFAEDYYFRQGKVMSDNQSERYPHEKGLKGAYVLSPLLLEEFGEMNAAGKVSNRIFKYITDMDYSQMYPSTIRQRNISPETEFFTLEYYEEDENGNRVDKTEEFMDDYISGDGYHFGVKYYGLPSLSQLINQIESEEN